MSGELSDALDVLTELTGIEGAEWFPYRLACGVETAVKLLATRLRNDAVVEKGELGSLALPEVDADAIVELHRLLELDQRSDIEGGYEASSSSLLTLSRWLEDSRAGPTA